MVSKHARLFSMAVAVTVVVVVSGLGACGGSKNPSVNTPDDDRPTDSGAGNTPSNTNTDSGTQTPADSGTQTPADSGVQPGADAGVVQCGTSVCAPGLSCCYDPFSGSPLQCKA